MKINLGSVRQQLEELGYEVVDVKHMLIARREVEITIYPDARLLVREDDEVRAREIVEMMYGIIMQGNNQ